MTGQRTTIILTTLAEYQTRFWIPVCKSLIEKGITVMVFSFDSRSCELLINAGLPNINISKRAAIFGKDLSPNDMSATFERYNVDNATFWESHERLVFKIYGQDQLDRKFASYLTVLDDELKKLIAPPGRLVMVQELGGFLSVLSSLFAARHNRIDNYFLEPAFFKGRLFSLRNELHAPRIDSKLASNVSNEVKSYIETTIKHQSIVVPDKDKHHYNSAIVKLVNFTNAKRLVHKLSDQYLLQKHQEFGHNWVYVGLHLQMLRNSWRLKQLYTQLDDCGDFVYFPFHVPNDVAITLRSPEYLDQLALIDFIARTLPSNLKLVVKEHPAMMGAIDAGRLKNLLKQHNNLKLVHPSTNNYDVINAASMLVSINSKSGAEAIMLGKPVIVLGDAFYSDCPFAQRVERLAQLPATIQNLPSASTKNIDTYFQTVWDQTFPGELYVNDPDNIENIANALADIGPSREC